MKKNTDKIKESIGDSVSVVLFGASRGCLYSVYLLKHLGYEISCIVETKTRTNTNLYAQKYVDDVLGIPVYSVEEGLKKYPNAVVLVTLLDIFDLKKTSEALHFQGAKKVLYLMSEIIAGYLEIFTKRKLNKALLDEVRYELFSTRARGLNKNIAPSVTIVITEKCNLSCVDCSIFVPQNANPVTSSIETVVNSVQNYCKSFDFAYRVCIMGGEPLLHKHIKPIIEELGKIDNLLFIDMATNGTIVPNESTLEVIKNNGVCLEVSDYGEHSWKMKELHDVCNQREILRFHQKFEYWAKAEPVTHHPRTDAELNAHFINCIASPGITNHILDGVLYRCLYSGITNRLKLAPVGPDEQVPIDFRPDQLTDETIKAIRALTFRSKPLLTCTHCDNGKTRVPPGIQTLKLA